MLFMPGASAKYTAIVEGFAKEVHDKHGYVPNKSEESPHAETIHQFALMLKNLSKEEFLEYYELYSSVYGEGTIKRRKRKQV